ncbi:MAG: ABC transporter substrate-binding protein [Gammaproteobacteria bacterium]|nr:ABC transporter substrate-binding protein [Gammaproteobacteria bacterium]MCZ6722431.1 ABC transporter substrate-binding protein [Gammaproteobacteria bacterium]MCZ6883321.1 ABC transporter substrate-binding protein [Gammaproteobacteria bacterium]
MKSKLLCSSLVAVSVFIAAPASAAVKIGMITTLTTKAGYLGEDIRDGFLLAIEQGGGQLGGVDVELLVEDDGRKPGKGLQISERYIKSEKVKIMTGIVFSNVAMAVVPKVVADDVFYISPNAGPSALAGKGCNKNYFNAAWQNDNLHEVMGQYVKDAGYASVYILAPNYPAGKDALAGFKRYYKGKIAGEVYTRLGQSDYAAELANLRAAKPDAVFFFLPGGMGINFLKQYAQAGLKQSIPVFGPAFSFDARILKAVGDAAVGVHNGSQWNFDLDNAANRTFVSAFKAKYNRMPTLYASQGYDTANLIASALKATSGDPSNMDAFRTALEKADFASVRGSFRFGSNHHPIQDIYVREVVKDSSGIYNKTVKKVFSDHADAYAGDCSL